jgi:uncharacterized protein (DUF58 family)
MLAPAPKLLRLTAIVVVPLATLAGLFPDVAGLCVGAVVLFFLLAGIDALRASGALAGLAVTLPLVVRLTRGQPGQVAVQLHNRTNCDRPVRLGLTLGPELVSPEETRRLDLPIASVAVTLQWPVTATARGRFAITTAHVGTPSPFGLWEVRRAIPTACEVRSYPDLRAEQRTAAAVFLSRQAPASRHQGLPARTHAGSLPDPRRLAAVRPARDRRRAGRLRPPSGRPRNCPRSVRVRGLATGRRRRTAG